MRSFWFLLLLALIPAVHAVGLLVPTEFDSLVKVYTSNTTEINVSVKGDSSNNTVTFFANSPDSRLFINGVQRYSTTFLLNPSQIRQTTLNLTGVNSTSVLAVDYGFILRSQPSAYFIMDISGLIVNFTASPGVGFRQVTKDTFQAKVCDVVCNSTNEIMSSSTLPLNESDSTVWFWDFGDGTNSTGRTPSHSYKSSPGSYKVTLTVTDGVSSATSNQAVCVGACVPVVPKSTPSSGAGGYIPPVVQNSSNLSVSGVTGNVQPQPPILSDLSGASGSTDSMVNNDQTPKIPSISATSNVAQIANELTSKGGKGIALVLVGMLISVLVLEIAVYSVAKRMPD
jgi:hypothetical protein